MKRGDQLLLGLLLVVIAVLTTTVSLNIILLKTASTPGAAITGFASSNNQTGVVNFTQAGVAGVLLIDDAIEFGAGFYNSSCSSTAGIAYSILDSQIPYNQPANIESNAAPRCWINTTSMPRNGLDQDFHVLENNGSTLVNISVIADKNAKDFLCGFTGTCSQENATVLVVSTTNETGACTANLLTTPELITNATTSPAGDGNRTVGLCDSLNFQDDQDAINIFYNITVPFDIPTGIKEMVVTYTAIAL